MNESAVIESAFGLV